MLRHISRSSSSTSSQRKPKLVDTHKPMGSVQAKPEMNGKPGGLDKLKPENGYVGNGQRRSRLEPGISNVEDDGSSNGTGGGEEWVSETGSEAARDNGLVSSRRIYADEDEVVDGWPKWLTDNISKVVLAGLVPKSAESYDKLDKVRFLYSLFQSFVVFYYCVVFCFQLVHMVKLGLHMMCDTYEKFNEIGSLNGCFLTVILT